jgi:uncharacterized protein (DUF427 family)
MQSSPRATRRSSSKAITTSRPKRSAANSFARAKRIPVCGWKGTASYYDIVVGDAVNHDGAWYYPATKPEASEIAGYVAFWRGVTVEA